MSQSAFKVRMSWTVSEPVTKKSTGRGRRKKKTEGAA